MTNRRQVLKINMYLSSKILVLYFSDYLVQFGNMPSPKSKEIPSLGDKVERVCIKWASLNGSLIQNHHHHSGYISKINMNLCGKNEHILVRTFWNDELFVLSERQEGWKCSFKISQHSSHFPIFGRTCNILHSLSKICN